MTERIACSLSPAAYAARRETTKALARRALGSRERVDGGARLRFAAGDDTERDLRAVIAAEAECCAFLSFDLAADGDELRLDVTGPAEAQPIIEELFA